MPPRKMDSESAQRIARARGRRDSFSKRAEMTARNQSQAKDTDGEKSKQQDEKEKKENNKTGS
ncbi:hypothetical protein GGR58DRAFT_496986 [Xylaria digitata]|nr:hypothetical protein GGR58DRAFT_496986 [Xylaria digitata]